MPEDDLTSTVPPVLPVGNNSNETTPTGNSIGTDLREKIFAAAAPVAAKFGVVLKTGRGRPTKDGRPKVSDKVEPVAPAPSGALGAVETVDAVASKFNSPAHQLFRRVVSKGFETEISILKNIVSVKADAAGLDEIFVSKALAAASPALKTFDDVAESFDYVAIKYGWNVERMPEIALGIDLVHLHSPFLTLMLSLNAEIKRKRDAEKKQQEGK